MTDELFVQRLLAMSDEEFERVVAEEVRHRCLPSDATALRSDAVLNRWFETLATLFAKVQAQLTSRRFDETDEAQRWRAGAVRFQQSVAARKREVKGLLSDLNRRQSEERDRFSAWRRALERLRERHGDEFQVLLNEEMAKDEVRV